MKKAINIENLNKQIVRVLSIAEPDVIENNPTGLEYFLIEDFVEPPELDNPMSINYSMWDKVFKVFKWVQVQYQNTATEGMLEIENLKAANATLQAEFATANENINLLIELQADILGGAV